jgi:hypothetical protein
MGLVRNYLILTKIKFSLQDELVRSARSDTTIQGQFGSLLMECKSKYISIIISDG